MKKLLTKNRRLLKSPFFPFLTLNFFRIFILNLLTNQKFRCIIVFNDCDEDGIHTKGVLRDMAGGVSLKPGVF